MDPRGSAETAGLMEGFHVYLIRVCMPNPKKLYLLLPREFTESSSKLQVAASISGGTSTGFETLTVLAGNESGKDRKRRIDKRRFEKNSRVYAIKTCRVTRRTAENACFAELASSRLLPFFIAWIWREFLSALDCRLRNTVGLTILKFRTRRTAGRSARSFGRRFPSFARKSRRIFRESHVPFLGYLLSRGIADIETIRGTLYCVEIGMCGRRANSGFDNFADVLN